MSIDYTFCTVVGVQIPKSWFYTTHMVTPAWCDHPKPEGAKHCPECGKKPPKPYKEQNFREAFIALVPKVRGASDQDAARDALHNESFSALLPDGIDVSYHHDNCGKEVLLVGVTLASLDEESKAHTKKPLPSIPTEDQINEALSPLDVPYKPGSYGLHLTCMGY